MNQKQMNLIIEEYWNDSNLNWKDKLLNLYVAYNKNPMALKKVRKIESEIMEWGNIEVKNQIWKA